MDGVASLIWVSRLKMNSSRPLTQSGSIDLSELSRLMASFMFSSRVFVVLVELEGDEV